MENGNKPAFASTDGQTFANEGLTKREYFAGLAMQGIASNPNLKNYTLQEKARSAVAWADEILKQLEK